MAICSLCKKPIKALNERFLLPRSQLNHRTTLLEIAFLTKSLAVYENRSTASAVWLAMIGMEVIG
jgi:hypothetical protein